MIKKFFKVLLFFLIIPVFFGVSNIINIYADSTEGEETKEYEYEDIKNEDYNKIVRTYKTNELIAKVEKRFCAPSGYEFVLSLTKEQAEAIASEAEKVGGTYKYDSISFYYHISGSKIWVDLRSTQYSYASFSKEQYVDFLLDSINGFTLFKVEELKVETTITLEYYIYVITEGDNPSYEFTFISDPIVIEPYDEYDFIDFSVSYYQDDGRDDRRINLRANPIEGFFYETYLPNFGHYGNYNSGFHTDTVTTLDWMTDEFGNNAIEADYEIDFLINDTVPVTGANANGQLEMTYPDEPFPIRARMTFTSGGKKYTFYSKSVLLSNPDLKMTIDGYDNRDTITKNTIHRFRHDFADCFPDNFSFTASTYFQPLLLDDKESGHYLFETGQLPETGIEGDFYYVPTEEEIERYKKGEEIYPDEIAHGSYYTWNKEEKKFDDYYGFSFDSTTSIYADEEVKLYTDLSIPYSGKWSFYNSAYFGYDIVMGMIQYQDYNILNVIDPSETKDYISVNVPDNVNVVQNEGEFEIISDVQTSFNIKPEYYYSYSLSKEGIVTIKELDNGELEVIPIGVGVVDLTIECESALFSKITKTIKIRSLDSIYNIAKLTVPDEFHYAGKDLTVSVDIRGFTKFQNLDIEWTVLDKKGNPVDPSKYQDNGDGTITFLKAEKNDYKITASYQGIELDTINVQVRKINVNKLIRQNIWWIFLITIGFVFIILFLKNMLKRGKTTVESIERVYSVYCDCLSDDKLTLAELKKINKEIKKCLHRCEDLNIEALNQYEKSIRYLRKSSNDAKSLLNEWENITPEDKSVYCERLNADLSKALNVAKEIETAKQISEEYHHNANRKNFETIEEDKSKK